jgi:SAM-dependent methyltransferase
MTAGRRGDRESAASRALLVRALHEARVRAFPAGQFVGQESFMQADEILDLARHAGVGPGSAVLDVCCGVAGPGRFLTRELACRYAGVDASADAIDIARRRSVGLDCRFEVARVPPVPAGRHDVVLLLETMLAFRDKAELIAGIAAVLRPFGRFACTVEAGAPLSAAERAAMPRSDTVWPIPLEEFTALLRRNGFRVIWQEDQTRSHREIAGALVDAFTELRRDIAAAVGAPAIDGLLAAHRLWTEWMGRGRISKIALVAERR